MDDGLGGKCPCPPDVEGYQVEDWQEVELEDDDDGYCPGPTV